MRHLRGCWRGREDDSCLQYGGFDVGRNRGSGVNTDRSSIGNVKDVLLVSFITLMGKQVWKLRAKALCNTYLRTSIRRFSVNARSIKEPTFVVLSAASLYIDQHHTTQS